MESYNYQHFVVGLQPLLYSGLDGHRSQVDFGKPFQVEHHSQNSGRKYPRTKKCNGSKSNNFHCLLYAAFVYSSLRCCKFLLYPDIQKIVVYYIITLANSRICSLVYSINKVHKLKSVRLLNILTLMRFTTYKHIKRYINIHHQKS